MNDMKRMIELLSKQIYVCTNINLTVKHIQLAQLNETTTDSMQCFWAVLNVLSCHALNDALRINFQQLDLIDTTKINFGLLGYSNIDFYACLKDSNNSKILLIALSWLIGTHNIFEKIIRSKIIESPLGHEFSVSKRFSAFHHPAISHLTIDDQADSILHNANVLSNNFKDLIQLTTEKAVLLNTLHQFNFDACNLSHLNIFELILIKSLYSKANTSVTNNESLEELQKSTILIETYVKWMAKQHTFFNWMEEALETSPDCYRFSSKNLKELSTLVCTIRHLTKKQIDKLEYRPEPPVPSNIDKSIEVCASRLRRNLDNTFETKEWQNKSTDLMKLSENELTLKIKKFKQELKLLLKLIPNCMQV